MYMSHAYKVVLQFCNCVFLFDNQNGLHLDVGKDRSLGIIYLDIHVSARQATDVSVVLPPQRSPNGISSPVRS